MKLYADCTSTRSSIHKCSQLTLRSASYLLFVDICIVTREVTTLPVDNKLVVQLDFHAK